MGDKAWPKEACLALVGAIDELIDDHEHARVQFLAKGAAGRDRDDVGHTDALQSVDIGAIVDRTRRLYMAAAVAWQKHQIDAFERTEEERIGRLAPGGFHVFPASALEARNVIDAAAAEDSENGLGHSWLMRGSGTGVKPEIPLCHAGRAALAASAGTHQSERQRAASAEDSLRRADARRMGPGSRF